MKYRIKNITIKKRENCEIYTSNLEEIRKRIMSENPGFDVRFSYDIIEEEKAPQ